MSLRIAFLIALAALPLAAQVNSREDHLGFRIKVPRGWDEIPVQPSERNIVARWKFPRSIRGFEASIEVYRFERDKPKSANAPAGEVKDIARDLEAAFRDFGREKSYLEFFKNRRQDGSSLGDPRPLKLAKKLPEGLKCDAMLYEGRVASGFPGEGDWGVLVGVYTFETHEYAVEIMMHERELKKDRSELLPTITQLEFTAEVAKLIKDTKAKWAEEDAPKPAVAEGAETPAKPASDSGREYDRSESEEVKRAREFKESLDRAKKDAESVPGWWYVISPSERYIVVTNIDKDKTNNQMKVKAVLDCLEAVRDLYEVEFPPRSPITAVSIVRICKDRETYMAYGGSAGSAGYWYSVDKELVLYFEGQVQFTYAVLRHEAFHQYIFYGAGDIAPHSWFNEGYGDYYAGAIVNGRKVTGIAPFAWRTDVVKTAARSGNYTPLEKLVRMSQGEYYANANLHYAQGWSLVYFLREGVAKTHPYAQILTTYFEELKITNDMQKAVDKTFPKDFDFKAFEEAWRAFTVSGRKVS